MEKQRYTYFVKNVITHEPLQSIEALAKLLGVSTRKMYSDIQVNAKYLNKFTQQYSGGGNTYEVTVFENKKKNNMKKLIELLKQNNFTDFTNSVFTEVAEYNLYNDSTLQQFDEYFKSSEIIDVTKFKNFVHHCFVSVVTVSVNESLKDFQKNDKLIYKCNKYAVNELGITLVYEIQLKN